MYLVGGILPLISRENIQDSKRAGRETTKKNKSANERRHDSITT